MMGLFLQDVVLHERLALGTFGFTLDNMKAYSLAFDPAPFHIDEEAARKSPYGALTAAGLHTACGWMTCYVAANEKARQLLQAGGAVLPEVGPSPGFKNMRWHWPVFAGDEVSYFTTATAKRPLNSRPGWGMLSGFNEGVNQHGALVFSFESAVLCKMR